MAELTAPKELQLSDGENDRQEDEEQVKGMDDLAEMEEEGIALSFKTSRSGAGEPSVTGLATPKVKGPEGGSGTAPTSRPITGRSPSPPAKGGVKEEKA